MKEQYGGGIKSLPFPPGEESRKKLERGGERADPRNYRHCYNANCRHTFIGTSHLSKEDEEHNKHEWNTYAMLSKQLQLWKSKKGRQPKCPHAGKNMTKFLLPSRSNAKSGAIAILQSTQKFNERWDEMP